MKIYFEHQYGKIENQNLQISRCYASDIKEEEDALNSGWLCLKENLWYNCRSTRVVPYEIKNNFLFEAKFLEKFDYKKYIDIYEIFIDNKNFNSIEEDKLFLKRDKIIEYWVENRLVGFSKVRTYKHSVELALHCHTMVKEEFSYDTLLYEINFFKNIPYVYLGPGYEKSSIYKSRLKNFEWFDGKVWNTDKNTYIDLCRADSNLQLTTSLK